MGEASSKSQAKSRRTVSRLSFNSFIHPNNQNKMIIKYTFDIETQQPAYAICNENHQCGYVTYDITKAIKAAQCKNFDQVQQLINA